MGRIMDRMGLQRHDRHLPIDALRGLIIALMALDHANYFVVGKGTPGEHWGGPFPTYADPLAFLTRWVTHPVAPGFFFLMGVGMVLLAASRRRKGWSSGRIRGHFLARGALLIALQLLVVNRAWQLGPTPFPRVYLGVLFALGGCMILGSFLIELGPSLLAVLAAALFLTTELAHPDPSGWGAITDRPLGLILLYSGGGFQLWSNYPILPWLELVVFGMAFGGWLRADRAEAYRRGLVLGGLFLGGFVILRSLDGFGNVRPRLGEGWIGFLNPVKYPPSMTFTLMTLGIVLLLLWLFGRQSEGLQAGLIPLAVLGRLPLLAYVVHLFLLYGHGPVSGPGRDEPVRPGPILDPGSHPPVSAGPLVRPLQRAAAARVAGSPVLTGSSRAPRNGTDGRMRFVDSRVP